MTPTFPTGGELLLVGVLTLGPCLVVAVLSVLLLRRAGRTSLRSVVLVVTLGALLSVVAGLAVVSQAMFLSAHDLGLLILVLTTTALAGTGGALLLARTLAREARRLVAAAAAVGGEEPVWDGPLPRTAELAAVAVQLQRTSADLEQARRAQQTAERARQELATWMSHDLRTPLAGIRAMSEALEDEVVADPADVRRYHRQLRVDAERLSGMVDDLFELSRLESGGPLHRSETVDVVALAQDVVVGCQALDPSRPLVLRTTAQALEVTAGAQDLARALRNLVANALRYSPATAPVEVHVLEVGADVVVQVRDSCGGIPLADVDRLFDVGFRGSSARTPDSLAGAGLGLAITRRLVEAHDGRVAVQPVAGGCCFSLTLPRRVTPPVGAPSHVPESRSARST